MTITGALRSSSRARSFSTPSSSTSSEEKIDTFRLFRKAIELSGLSDTVVPMVTTSAVAARMWSTPLSMVFIDGSHTYPGAFSDYVSWSPLLLSGGILAIHDIFEDPSEGGQAPHYIYKLALDSGLYEELPMVKTLGVLKRRRSVDIPKELFSKRDW